MSNAYSIPPRRARWCRAAAWLFLLAAVIEIAVVGFSLSRPGVEVECKQTVCVSSYRPETLLPEEEQPALARDARSRDAFRAYFARSWVRAGAAVITLVRTLPLVALLFAVGIALRALAARVGDDLGRALPWLRRAALAAVGIVLAKPIGDTLMFTLLSPGLPDGPHYFFTVQAGDLAKSLLLAFAAYAVVWAVEAGHRAERDVAEFV